jgi:hypothetical protein
MLRGTVLGRQRCGGLLIFRGLKGGFGARRHRRRNATAMRLGIAGDSLGSRLTKRPEDTGRSCGRNRPYETRVMELRDRALLERQTTMRDQRDRGRSA